MSQSRTEETLHPSAGARFLFERETADEQRGVYRAAIFTPDERFDYRADLGMDGSVALNVRGASAGEALESKLATMARLIARDAAKKRAGDLPPWPHRVLRWRGPR